jgi:hypothetical protein
MEILSLFHITAVFPSGMPTEIADRPDFPFKYYGHTDARKASQGLLFTESSQIRFIGTNYEEDTLSKSNHNYAVAVYREGKSSAKVITANGLFKMKQIKLADVDGIDTETVTDVDFNTMRTELTERFGARKRRRELRSIENNKFNVDSDKSSLLALETAMETASVQLPKAEPASDLLTALLPTHNAEATVPEDIYPLSSFIPRGLWDSLDHKSLIKPTESKEELEFNYPSFVIMRRSRFVNLQGDEAKNVARILLMLTYLLRMMRLKKVRNVAEMINCPAAVGEHLKRVYLPRGDDKQAKAKMTCHAVILAIIASTGCTLDNSALRCLAADCQTTVSQLLPFFYQVGAKATKEKARLVAPLKLPEIQSGGSSRRR